MIPRLVPEIEGGYPERDGGEEGAEGLVLTYSICWMMKIPFTVETSVWHLILDLALRELSDRY